MQGVFEEDEFARRVITVVMSRDGVNVRLRAHVTQASASNDP
jgi:hypothetical protein